MSLFDDMLEKSKRIYDSMEFPYSMDEYHYFIEPYETPSGRVQFKISVAELTAVSGIFDDRVSGLAQIKELLHDTLLTMKTIGQSYPIPIKKPIDVK